MKALTIILVLVCIGLGVALLLRHNAAVEQEQADRLLKQDLTNLLEQTQEKFEEQERVNMLLQKDLDTTYAARDSFSNRFVIVSQTLVQTQADAKAAGEAARAEIERREQQIGQLTAQGEELTKRIDGLNGSISNLNGMIAETERQLDAAEGDKEFLLGELKRLQAEKADLERQFNDLDLLRTQVAKIREELSVARRLDWIRRGIYGGGEIKKGAELLMQGVTAAVPATNFNLNVELMQDGSARVLTPGSATNAPSGTNSPAQP